MIQFHSQQIDLLESTEVARFEVRCVDWLRDQFPHRTAMHDETGEHASVRAGIQSAAMRGFISERNVVKYLYLRTLLGADFDIRPNSAAPIAVLTDRSLPPDTRIDRTFELLENYLAGSEPPAPLAAHPGSAG